MTGGKDGLSDSVAHYAYENYRRQGRDELAGLLTFGIGDIVAATRALAAANEAQALSVDPQVVDSVINKLTAMQDNLENVRKNAHVLADRTPLGGGYAKQIGEFNGQLGEQVVTGVVPETIVALEELKTQIMKSRASYQNVDQAKAHTFDTL